MRPQWCLGIARKALEALLKKWLAHPYFKKRPPKSSGREVFGEPFFQRILPDLLKAHLSRFDVIATLTEFTARSLALNYRLHLRSPPQSVILTGGGAANPALVTAIRDQLCRLSPRSKSGQVKVLAGRCRASNPRRSHFWLFCE